MARLRSPRMVVRDGSLELASRQQITRSTFFYFQSLALCSLHRLRLFSFSFSHPAVGICV